MDVHPLVTEAQRGVIRCHVKGTVWALSIVLAFDGHLLLMVLGQHFGENRFNLSCTLYLKGEVMFAVTSVPSCEAGRWWPEVWAFEATAAPPQGGRGWGGQQWPGGVGTSSPRGLSAPAPCAPDHV